MLNFHNCYKSPIEQENMNTGNLNMLEYIAEIDTNASDFQRRLPNNRSRRGSKIQSAITYFEGEAGVIHKPLPKPFSTPNKDGKITKYGLTKGSNMNLAYDYKFKLITIFDSGAGKSCLISRFTDGVYIGTGGYTLTASINCRTVRDGEHLILREIWDTCGQENFKAITSAYVRDARGILLVYDCTNIDTFTHMNDWLKFCDDHTKYENVPRILIGTKCDNEPARQVTRSQGENYAEFINVPFFETSSKINLNVNEVFFKLAAEIKQRFPHDELVSQAHIKLGRKQNEEVKSTSKCC